MPTVHINNALKNPVSLIRRSVTVIFRIIENHKKRDLESVTKKVCVKNNPLWRLYSLPTQTKEEGNAALNWHNMLTSLLPFWEDQGKMIHFLKTPKDFKHTPSLFTHFDTFFSKVPKKHLTCKCLISLTAAVWRMWLTVRSGKQFRISPCVDLRLFPTF